MELKNNPNSISTNNVKSILRTQKGNFWIGTHDGGLNYLNPNKKPFVFSSILREIVIKKLLNAYQS